MDWSARESALRAILSAAHPEALRAGFADGATDYGSDLQWSQAVRDRADAFTRALAQEVAGMTATQRDRIATLVGEHSGNRAALQAALEADGYPARQAELISEDQIAKCYNVGVVLAAYAAGATHVDVRDGETDPVCQSANGARWTLEQATANPVSHPRCIRSFSIAQT